MPKFVIYHRLPDPDTGRIGFSEELPVTFSSETFERVAEVDCSCVGEIFELTNHIMHGWQKNPGVRATPGPKRSTSVGDIVCENGDEMRAWICARLGWKRLAVSGVSRGAVVLDEASA